MNTTLQASAAERATRELMDRWYEAWNAHDLDAIKACLTSDAVVEEPGAPGGAHRGIDQITAWVNTTLRASHDFRLTEHERWVSDGGAVIATYFTATGTLSGPMDPPGFAPTDGPFEFTGMDRSEVRDGRIVRHQIFFDLLGVGRQMAAVPEEGTLADRLGVRMQRAAARKLRKRNRS